MDDASSESPHPRERLAAFLAFKGWSKVEAGRAFGCTGPFVSMVLSGEKLPGRLTANAIERVTREEKWPEGPLTSEEWDVVDPRNAETLAPTGTDPS